MGERAIEIEETTAIGKRIRRYIQNAHDTRTRQIEQMTAAAKDRHVAYRYSFADQR